MPVPSPVATADLVDRIDALLPQTQCGLCKTPGCRPYAEAIAAGEAINHCVPGGQPTIEALAGLMGLPALPLDPDYGITPPHRLVAWIREAECIGCTKCIQACPVDAIVGAAKLMHTVIVAECTGCNLCVAPCPVDCIDLVPGPDIPMTWHRPPAGRIPLLPADAATIAEQAAADAARARADLARQRFLARNARLASDAAAKAERRHQADSAGASLAAPATAAPMADSSSLMIAAAMARSQLKKLERQIAVLEARGENADDLKAQLPALQAAVSTAQQAMAASQPG